MEEEKLYCHCILSGEVEEGYNYPDDFCECCDGDFITEENYTDNE